jgi:excinuclease ABC subunit A
MRAPPIVLKKVRVHNLQEVDLTLEPGQLVVFTGVSGSGKSSLAFDTIYVEGQRRYIESLSHQARRNLADLPKPEAESITGIAPTIAIEQKQAGNTPRSTVGTMTGIYDFLRVLYARIGIPHCPVSKESVAAQSREKIVARLKATPLQTKFILLSPYARGKKAEFKEDFAELLSKGFMRLRVDGEWIELGTIQQLGGSQAHDIDLVIDRLTHTKENESRITEAVNQALDLGNGLCSAYFPDSKEEIVFSEHSYSPKSGLSYGPLQPHDFSFNHPSGMCPTCHGLGVSREFDLHKIIDPEKSIAEDCCAIGSSYNTVRYGNIYDNLARIYKAKITTPWKKLPEPMKHAFLYGIDQKWVKMVFTHPEKKTTWLEYVKWRGVIAEAKERLAQAKSEVYRRNMGEWMTERVCPTCHGARIKPYPAETRLGGKKITELTQITLAELAHFFETLQLTEVEKIVAVELVKEIRERIAFLLQVGVHYLQLDRTSPTLSGGESQRVRLASQIGAGLVGAIYVLDEPSIGLHPADHHKLIGTLRALRDQGNTVLVVEHDRDTMFAADQIVDVGPGAGSHGGRILVQGTAEDVMRCKESLTGDYLSGRRTIASGMTRSVKQGLEIVGATHHNLKNVTAHIPLGGLICITGVSGSGKSSLISDILVPALSNTLHKAKLQVGAHTAIRGIERIDKAIAVDQTPIGRTPRSNAATYIKLFDDIRDLFAELPESKLRGFTPAHFSFNVKEGSCTYCGGLGKVHVDMDFMEDAELGCPQCHGQRFDPEILAVQFKEMSISDILNLDVEHALPLFDALPQIRKKLEVLSQVGLDYLRLGQPSTTLSGGEAQRIKLAKELVRPSTGKTLYILDEPTTGLHFHDVARLCAVLQKLVDKGNTVLVIEHNIDLIATADWVLEMGPKAGAEGGQIVAEGTVAAIAKKKTATGLALREQEHNQTPKPKPETSEIQSIQIENAQQNNLKGFDLSIPRGKITVFTGPSGSGKSSLAFETIYAEGQRRYTETLPSYARQYIKQLPKPKIDRIAGLSPSIALEQKTGGLNPRSTIGTMTEIYDLLRVLYAHMGTPYCPETGEEIRNISKEYVVQKLLDRPASEKMVILSPLELQKKETFEEMCERQRRLGYVRIRLNGEYYELDQKIPFESFRKNELFLVIDRMSADPRNEKRLFEAVDKATSLSNGSVSVDLQHSLLYFNLSFAVESTGKSYPPITPQTFSFNAESGMCQECQGLGLTYGARLEDDPDFRKVTIFDLCDRLFKDRGTDGAFKLVEEYFRKLRIPVGEKKLSPDALATFLGGGPELRMKNGLTLKWLGVQSALASIARMAKKILREDLLPLLSTNTCPVCEGTRLNPLARAVRIQGVSIADFCHKPIGEALDFLEQLKPPPFLAETHDQMAKSFSFLLSIGLSYLTLDRSAPTLSGGEIQRIRLARQLGSGLTSCLYVLDEPTIGLHPYNNQLLNVALQKLCNLGNTLILVEHDPLTVLASDYLVDFGPKAGGEGGYVTASGTIEEILQNPNSLTGDYLSGRKQIPIPKKRRPLHFDIEIKNATLHNLHNISVALPRSAMTCLTGVSGSGKSTLMRHLLKPAAERAVAKRTDTIEYLGATFSGLSFEKVICIDQSPIGQTSRADVSTYTDIQPLFRSHFAALPGAKMKGLQPKHFSPNHRRGMCPTCWGLGYKTVDLQYLPAVRIPCPACHGYRLNPVSLEVHYKGKNLGQVLEMSVEAALQWFSEIPKIAKRLQILCSVGLAYLKLGQEIASLSGGEAQRLRLSRELAKRESGQTLYLIDEPTVGLHSEDILRLLPIFHKLVDKKNTLVIIEHNIDVIVNSDYVIDLGPDAGIHGGEIMAQGTPEEVAKAKKSRTAPFIKERLG